jgi:hypothetical protein
VPGVRHIRQRRHHRLLPPGVDVMITIFGDLRRKKWRFSQFEQFLAETDQLKLIN